MLLRTNADFAAVLEWQAEPEARMPFDKLGEPRNADLLVHARDDNGPFLIAVEAKGNETFGSTVAQILAAARERKAENPHSNAEARALSLLTLVLGAPCDVSATDGAIRYQLLTATAGLLAAASEGIDRVVLLVQEFRSPATKDRKHDANARDLDRFTSRLSGGALS